jgi:hypothetical protein
VPERFYGRACQEYRARRRPQHTVGYAAEDDALQSAAPVRRQRDKVGLGLASARDDNVDWRTLRTQRLDAQSTSPEIGSNVSEILSSNLRFGTFGIDGFLHQGGIQRHSG